MSLDAVRQEVEWTPELPGAEPAPDRVAALVARLKRKYRDCITGEAYTAARPGRYGAIPAQIDARLRQALHSRGIQHLYSHQAAAWGAIADGAHVVIATPTASGKTLCFKGPVLDALRTAGWSRWFQGRLFLSHHHGVNDEQGMPP